MDEIAGPRFSDKLKSFAPAHAGFAAYDIDDALHRTVMVGTGLGIGMDHHRSGPQFLSTAARIGNRRSAMHSWSLRCVRIELTAFNHADTVVLPFILLLLRRHGFFPSFIVMIPYIPGAVETWSSFPAYLF